MFEILSFWLYSIILGGLYQFNIKMPGIADIMNFFKLGEEVNAVPQNVSNSPIWTILLYAGVLFAFIVVAFILIMFLFMVLKRK